MSVRIYSLICCWLTSSASATILYDVNFEPPVHSAGQPPTIAGGPVPRATPNQTYFLPAQVVTATQLDGQALLMNGGAGTENSNQVIFGIGEGRGGFSERYSQLNISLDVVAPTGAAGTLAVWFDIGEGGYIIKFANNQVILDRGSSRTSIALGNVPSGQRCPVRVLIDKPAQA